MISTAQKITIAIFGALILFPIVNSVFLFVPEEKTSGKSRPDQEVPAFSWGEARNITSVLEENFSNSFGGRVLLFSLYSKFKQNVLHTSPLPLVVLGKDGWLFFGKGKNRYAIDDYRHVKPFGERELSGILKETRQIRTVVKEHGAEYYSFIAPDKHSIYPEMLPWNIQKVRPSRRVDDAVAYLSSKSKLPFHDLTPALLEAKKQELPCPLFLESDTHWNELGGFFAYQKIIEVLKEDFPDLQARSLDDYQVEAVKVSGGDLASMIASIDEYPQTLARFTPKFERSDIKKYLDSDSIAYNNPKFWGEAKRAKKYGKYYMRIANKSVANKIKVLIFRDSFTTALVPFFIETFSECVFVDGQPLEAKFIEDFKPDIVMHITVERALFKFLPKQLRQSQAIADEE